VKQEDCTSSWGWSGLFFGYLRKSIWQNLGAFVELSYTIYEMVTSINRLVRSMLDPIELRLHWSSGRTFFSCLCQLELSLTIPQMISACHSLDNERGRPGCKSNRQYIHIRQSLIRRKSIPRWRDSFALWPSFGTSEVISASIRTFLLA